MVQIDGPVTGSPSTPAPEVLMREAVRCLRLLDGATIKDGGTFFPGDLPDLLDEAANTVGAEAERLRARIAEAEHPTRLTLWTRRITAEMAAGTMDIAERYSEWYRARYGPGRWSAD